jgi:hypothetical protein
VKQFQFKKNVTDVGTNITEETKDLVENMDKGLHDLAK